MSKTQEELNQLKMEYDTLKAKLKELSDDELKKVVGGNRDLDIHPDESGIGTDSDNNIIPPSIRSK